MLSEKYIMSLVRNYAKSPAGKAKIKGKYGIDYKGDGAGNAKLTLSDYIRYGEKMKVILYNHVNPLIKSITMEDIIVSEPYADEDGQYRIDISFAPGSLQRESLYPKAYSGTQNIVLLFTTGWHAKNYVYGSWGTEQNVRSRKDREGNDFLAKAVEAFNLGYGKNNIARAELVGDYADV